MYSLLKMVNFHFHVSLPECNQLRICKIMRTVTKTVVRSTGKQDVPLHGDATYGVLELQSFVGIHEAKNSAKSPKAIFKIISNFLLQTLKTCLFFFEPRVIKVTILQTVWRWWSFSMLTALVQVLMPGLRLGLTNSPWAKPYKFMRSRCWETHWLTFVMCLDKDECYDSDPYGIKFSLLDQVGRLVSSGNYERKKQLLKQALRAKEMHCCVKKACVCKGLCFFGLGYSWQLHLTHVQSTIKFYYVSSQVKSHLHVQQRVVYHQTADLGVIVLVGQICP